MDSSLQNIINDKIDYLTHKLYKVEKSIRNYEDRSRIIWENKYEPMLHSDIDDSYILYKTYDEYYLHVLDSRKYRNLINKKNIIEIELGFCYKHIEDINRIINTTILV